MFEFLKKIFKSVSDAGERAQEKCPQCGEAVRWDQECCEKCGATLVEARH